MARISVKPEVASQMSDNDLLLLTKDHPHSEGCREQLHALGFMEGHEGGQSLRVKFFLSDDSQAGRPAQLERCAIAWRSTHGTACAAASFAANMGASWRSMHGTTHGSTPSAAQHTGGCAKCAAHIYVCPLPAAGDGPLQGAVLRCLLLLPPAATLLLLHRVRAMRAGIEARDSCWWVQRLFNMSTITREWVALQHAHLMPFRCVAGGAPHWQQQQQWRQLGAEMTPAFMLRLRC